MPNTKLPSGKAADRVILSGTPFSEPGDVELLASAAVAAAANNLVLAAAPGKTTFITGFSVTGLGATLAGVIEIQITGPATTLLFKFPILATVLGLTPLVVNFQRPIPAAAPNTAITLVVPSFGAGNTAAAAHVQGFQR